MEILLVCTANVCRSPMAEALLATKLADLGSEASVSSAGLLPGGRPVADGAVLALRRMGIDITGRTSRELLAGDVARADLVVGMAREHVREVVVLDPGAWPRSLTLKEIVARGEQLGPRPPGQPFGRWLAALQDGRERASMVGESPADDVADPIGMPLDAFEATARELSDLTGRLARLGWGAVVAPERG